MKNKTYSFFALFLLWFGAGISIAEVLTGGLLFEAELSLSLTAIFLGHLCGVVLIGFIANIGFKEQLPSLRCTRLSFGKSGSYILSLANILQLIGWTAVMIQQGGQALNAVAINIFNYDSEVLFIFIIAVVIIFWVIGEVSGVYALNILAVLLLISLCLYLSWVLWQKWVSVDYILNLNADMSGVSGGKQEQQGKSLNFGRAFELSLLMPLSWLPLVADYASKARNQKTACLAPALGYFLSSSWMYLIGLFGYYFFAESDPVALLLTVNLGFVALGIVALSTITTTFLDVYSATMSSLNIFPNISKKTLSIFFVIFGTTIALFLNNDFYISFLYLIGAVFAPLSAIICYDYYFAKIDFRDKKIDFVSICSLSLGFIYHTSFSSYFDYLSDIFGVSLTCLLLTFCLHALLRAVFSKKV